jgi:hypothetical protein
MIAKRLLPAVFSARWLPGFLVLGSCLLSAAPERPLSTGVRQTVPAIAPVQADLAENVFRMLEEVAAKKVWPGFTPSAWPLALYDGEKTFLLWHPDPPAEFKPVPGRPGVLICPGRYPGVESGSTCDIAGIRTATLIVASRLNTRALIEETFHVFWLSRHKVFRPNEMARYAYPLTDVENLAGLLAESEALARALDAGTPEQARRWTAAALEQRSGRRLRLDGESAAFETDLEMLEGPANFSGDFAVGETSAMTAANLRRQNCANATGKWKRGLEEIRWRFYYTGEAMGWLLERFVPGWKERLEAEPQPDHAKTARGRTGPKWLRASGVHHGRKGRLPGGRGMGHRRPGPETGRPPDGTRGADGRAPRRRNRAGRRTPPIGPVRPAQPVRARERAGRAQQLHHPLRPRWLGRAQEPGFRLALV